MTGSITQQPAAAGVTVLRPNAPRWLWLVPVIIAAGSLASGVLVRPTSRAVGLAIGLGVVAALAALTIADVRRSSVALDGSRITVTTLAGQRQPIDLAQLAAVGLVGSRGGGTLILIGPWEDGAPVPRHAGLPRADVDRLRQAGNRARNAPSIRQRQFLPYLAEQILTRPGILLSDRAARSLNGRFAQAANPPANPPINPSTTKEQQ